LSLFLQSPITVQSPGGNAVNVANLAGGPFTSGESATLTAGGAAIINTANSLGNNNTGLRIQSAGSAIITSSGNIDVTGTASDWAILAIAQGQTAAVTNSPVTAMVTYGSPGAPGLGLRVGIATGLGGRNQARSVGTCDRGIRNHDLRARGH
jgi:hypothetical protein